METVYYVISSLTTIVCLVLMFVSMHYFVKKAGGKKRYKRDWRIRWIRRICLFMYLLLAASVAGVGVIPSYSGCKPDIFSHSLALSLIFSDIFDNLWPFVLVLAFLFTLYRAKARKEAQTLIEGGGE